MKNIIFILIILSISISYGKDIITLLNEYEKVSDLSLETQKESLGHVYIVTRKDLDIMEARTLKDVLISIPMFHYFPNRFGIYTLLNPGERAGISIKYRLFIDNQEVNSVHSASPFSIYDHYPLDHINHIEIYYSMGAISVTSEPSQLIIKLYTKKPERENGSLVRVSYSNKSDYSGSLLITKNINEEESVLFLLNRTFFNYESVFFSNGSVSRDTFFNSFLFKYRYYNTLFETGYTSAYRDIFTGFAIDAVPDKGKFKGNDFFVNISSDWLSDKSLNFILSYSIQNRDYNEYNKEGIIYPLFMFNLSNPVVAYNETRRFEKYKFHLEKKYTVEKHTFLFGTYLKYKRQKIDEIGYILKDSSLHSYYQPVKFLRIYSGFVEDIIQIKDSISIIAGFKLDNYKFSTSKSKTEYSIRGGFASLINDKFLIKGFLSRSYLLPSFFILENTAQGILDPIIVYVASGEINYKIDAKQNISIVAQQFWAKKHYDLDVVNKRFINGKDKEYGVVSLLYKKRLNPFSTVKINYWISSEGDSSLSPSQGGFIKLFSEYDNWKVYNEIIYKAPYKPLNYDFRASFNYNLSISYRLPDNWSVNLRVENLLRKSPKVVRVFPYGVSTYYNSEDRKFYVNINKFF